MFDFSLNGWLLLHEKQALKEQLPSPASDVAVVPIDLCGPFQNLEKASRAAMQAFGGLDFVFYCVGKCDCSQESMRYKVLSWRSTRLKTC